MALALKEGSREQGAGSREKKSPTATKNEDIACLLSTLTSTPAPYSLLPAPFEEGSTSHLPSTLTSTPTPCSLLPAPFEEIANALFLSRRTVEKHLEDIYSLLDCRNRASASQQNYHRRDILQTQICNT